MVCLFLMRIFYLFIFNRKMAEMRRPMDFWKGLVVSFFSSKFQTIITTAPRTRSLRKSWSLLPTLCMEHLYTQVYLIWFPLVHFYYLHTFRGNLPDHSHSKELPNIPGEVSVRYGYYGISVVVVIILITGIIAAGLVGNVGISGPFIISFCFRH